MPSTIPLKTPGASFSLEDGLPPNVDYIDHQAIFSHTTSLYDVPGETLVHITSLHSSCHIFFEGNIRRAVRIMSTNNVTGEEGLQVELLKMVFTPLTSTLQICLIILSV